MADFLSQKEIEEAIRKYSITPQGKAEIRRHHPGKFIARYSTGQTSATDKRLAKTIGEDMIKILHKHITKDTRVMGREGLSDFHMSAIKMGEPKIRKNSGYYSMSILFDSDALRRDSLDQQKYPDGVHDIIKLFVTGYDADGAVSGVWHGSYHVSLRSRKPNDFMESAVKEFNQKYSGVAEATLDGRYKSK